MRTKFEVGEYPTVDEFFAGMVLQDPSGTIWILWGYVDGIAELTHKVNRSYIDRTNEQLVGWSIAEPWNKETYWKSVG